MAAVTKNFRELYDWLITYRPDYLEWCKNYARSHLCPLGAVITWKEDTIRSMMEEQLKEKTYEELVGDLRKRAMDLPEKFSRNAVNIDLFMKAADAIEKLLKVASAMHTWIFLHTGDEQAAYDECGLTDEMNAALGYGGQFVIEPPKE